MKVAAFSTSSQPFAARSNCALGFVNQHRVQHRVQSLMTGLCRTANSCKAGLIMGALRIACNGLCTAARFHSAEENHGWLLWCSEGPDCLQHYNRCPTLFNYSRSLQPGTSERISPMAIFSDFLFKMAVRSDRLCILVAQRMLVSQRSICGEHTMASVSTSKNLCMAELR